MPLKTRDLMILACDGKGHKYQLCTKRISSFVNGTSCAKPRVLLLPSEVFKN